MTMSGVLEYGMRSQLYQSPQASALYTKFAKTAKYDPRMRDYSACFATFV